MVYLGALLLLVVATFIIYKCPEPFRASHAFLSGGLRRRRGVDLCDAVSGRSPGGDEAGRVQRTDERGRTD